MIPQPSVGQQGSQGGELIGSQRLEGRVRRAAWQVLGNNCREPIQHVGQIGKDVDLVTSCALNDRVPDGRCVSAPVASKEQIVLSSKTRYASHLNNPSSAQADPPLLLWGFTRPFSLTQECLIGAMRRGRKRELDDSPVRIGRQDANSSRLKRPERQKPHPQRVPPSPSRAALGEKRSVSAETLS